MLGGPLEWSALFESLTIHIFLRVCVCLAFLALEEKGARERKKYIILKKKNFFLKSGKSFYSQVLKMLLFLIFFVFKFHFYLFLKQTPRWNVTGQDVSAGSRPYFSLGFSLN